MIPKDVLKKIQTKKNIESISKKDFWLEFEKSSIEVLEGTKFKFNEDNTKVVNTILRYFSGSKDFNEYGIIKNKACLSKGLLVSGNIGVGKTILFKAIQKAGRELCKKGYKRAHFKNISCGSFVSLYMSSTRYNSLDFNLKTFEKNKLYIDDLGVETLAFNQYELMEQVLFERYSNKALTFITTNLKMTEILSRYGERVADRLPEMCNIITWNGKSLRHE
ncbi:ATP-binding protein [Tenacibaculum aiptasiae]|uniref:ATP-binding protein n=1 Tax=Tenacibaculum aiptasiae TaxID=426481 RepID=UPI00232C3863|nr:ATP-binding protein [Tenacibaculum aiptasiae]